MKSLKMLKKPIAVLATSFILGTGFVVTEGIFGEPLTVEAASTTTYTVTASALNVRSGAGTNHKVLGTVKKGATLSVSSKSNGWYKINHNGKTGYVSASYVKESTSSSNSSSSTTNYTVTASSLNVRSGAGTKYSTIGSLKKNQSVSVSSISNGWAKISYNGKTAYVSSSYLSKSSSSNSNSNSSNNSSTSTTTYYVTASSLNVRSGAGKKHSTLGTLKKNQSISVSSVSNGWAKFSYNGKTAYVSSSYLSKSNPSSGNSNSSNNSSTSTTTYYVTASSLNVRSGAGTKHSTLGTLKKNQSISVSSVSNGWAKFSYNGKTAYVSSSYLSKSNPSSGNSNSSNSSIVDTVNNMKTLGKAEQLVLVTAGNSSSQSATIRTFEKANGKWKQVNSMTGQVGKKGMTDNMSEGSQAAPTGKYTIGTAFGRGANPGTKLPYRKITSDDVWVDDPSSSLYNTWQKASQNNGRWKSAEKMNIAEYDLGFVINYNTSNPVSGKGSAIFFHVSGSYGYTLGCTATSKSNVSTILKWLNPDKNPVIIQTPESGLGKY